MKSPFALVLSGTPLENRLDELYSVVEFIDDRRLGPAFRFYNRYRIVDEKGKVLGYKNLDELRERLKPVLLRRTRKMVMSELPPRATEIRRIPPTDEQLTLHNAQMRIIQTIICKKYISEMDLLRLQKALLICRMAANSTFLVDKVPPGYSSKLVEFENLIDQLIEEEDRKIVLFSEWTTMLSLIEPLLGKRKVGYVRLDGSIPQKKRQGLIHQFQKEPDCKLFITTNAGATGLNLQAANTVINVDLPWNPAVLGAENLPCPPDGTEEARAGLSPCHRRNPGRKAFGNPLRQTSNWPWLRSIRIPKSRPLILPAAWTS